MEYSPRQVAGAPLSARVTLKGAGNNPANPPFGLALGYDDINGNYPASPPAPAAPTYSVQNLDSVLVPHIDDGWPPEPMGDPPSPCVQYAAEVSLADRDEVLAGRLVAIDRIADDPGLPGASSLITNSHRFAQVTVVLNGGIGYAPTGLPARVHFPADFAQWADGWFGSSDEPAASDEEESPLP